MKISRHDLRIGQTLETLSSRLAFVAGHSKLFSSICPMPVCVSQCEQHLSFQGISLEGGDPRVTHVRLPTRKEIEIYDNIHEN